MFRSRLPPTHRIQLANNIQAAARAIYPRTKTVVLDDFLSALDRQTGRQIFQNLFGNDGLLRQLKTTVVLATHSGE